MASLASAIFGSREQAAQEDLAGLNFISVLRYYDDGPLAHMMFRNVGAAQPTGDPTKFLDLSGNWWTQIFDLDVCPEQFGGGFGDPSRPDTLAIQYAVSNSHVVRLSTKTYYTDETINGTVKTRIIGAGLASSRIEHSGNKFFLKISNAGAAAFGSYFLEDLSLVAKFALDVNGPESSHALADPIIHGGVRRVYFEGTYVNTVDPRWGTDLIKNSADVYESCVTAVDPSPANTYADVSKYGISIRLTKCFDMVVDDCQFRLTAVPVAFIGSDLNKIKGGRMHETGIFVYDKRVGTYGSQNYIDGVDLLHNRRAGGILVDQAFWGRTQNCYYECYANSSLFVYTKLSYGYYLTDNRVDDPYNSDSVTKTTPLIIFQNPIWQNQVQRNRYSPFNNVWARPTFRVIEPISDGFHCESIVFVDNDQWFPRPYSGGLGVRTSDIDPTKWNVKNTIEAVPFAPYELVKGEYAAHSWVFLTIPIKLALPSITSRDFVISARVLLKSAQDSSIAIVSNHLSAANNVRQKQSLAAQGLSSSEFRTVNIPISLANHPLAGDMLTFEWNGAEAYLSAVEIKSAS